ncbi:MAG: NUDIX domain-containing protein [Proteobacteria bacterium]|nr:NUDIX domain-containing protein [Pseudomonadota bacterium]
MKDISDRVRIHVMEILSQRKYTLKNVDASWRRNDGEWQRLTREVYEKGDGAAILLYNRFHRTVVLIRQFRLPAFLNGYNHELIEVPAGMLDGAAPEERIRAEVQEETGYSISQIEKIFEVFMSPGALTEKLHLFVAAYNPSSKTGDGGGLKHEGEDIAVLELPFDEALAMVNEGRICDAKTIMLLQYAQLNIFHD